MRHFSWDWVSEMLMCFRWNMQANYLFFPIALFKLEFVWGGGHICVFMPVKRCSRKVPYKKGWLDLHWLVMLGILVLFLHSFSSQMFQLLVGGMLTLYGFCILNWIITHVTCIRTSKRCLRKVTCENIAWSSPNGYAWPPGVVPAFILIPDVPVMVRGTLTLCGFSAF